MQDKETLIFQIFSFGEKYPNEVHPSRCIDLLKKYNDDRAFFRDHFDDGHFTGSVLVINRDKTKVLLMHHVKYGTWQQFGGHADGEVDMRKVALRELEEEARITEKDADIGDDILSIDIHTVPAHKDEPAHFHYDITFLATVDEAIKFERQEEEVHDIQWFSISGVLDQLDSGKFSSGLQEIIVKV